MKPDCAWDGKYKSLKFRIIGESDSDYAKCPLASRSASGFATVLEGAPVTMKSMMPKIVALSVKESVIIAAVCCAQDMIHMMRILNPLGLLVELTMILREENSGAADITNSWSSDGRTRYMDQGLTSSEI